MSKFGVIDQLVEMTAPNALFHNITVGTVVDTNDPQQMGRVRAICPAMGDIESQAIEHTPWAMYGSPFGGVNELTTRGPAGDKSSGPVAYGMWAIPKIGSYVLIMCIDGNPATRVWLGCIPGQFFTHTLPHGRYSSKVGTDNVAGPLTSTEQPIEPLHTNHTEAFSDTTTTSRNSFEYVTRGADNQAAYVGPIDVDQRIKYSSVADDRNDTIAEADGSTLNFSQGYQKSQIQPDLVFPSTDGINFDSQIYSMTTPGFHSWSMDDSADNCRMRLRTTAGHQIILDDTNERIYISTAKGKTWIEIDEKGTIDIYGEEDISIRSESDINLMAEKTVRISGKEGIHMASEGEIRMHSGGDTSIKANGTLRIRATAGLWEFDTTYSLKIGSTLELSSTNLTVSTGGDIGNAGVVVSGGEHFAPDMISPSMSLNNHIHTQGPDSDGNGQVPTNPGSLGGGSGSASANPPSAQEKPSYFVSRAPQHEPWARTYLKLSETDKDTGGDPGTLTLFTTISSSVDAVSEYAYTDPSVGRVSTERSKDFTRNSKWHR